MHFIKCIDIHAKTEISNFLRIRPIVHTEEYMQCSWRFQEVHRTIWAFMSIIMIIINTMTPIL